VSVRVGQPTDDEDADDRHATFSCRYVQIHSNTKYLKQELRNIHCKILLRFCFQQTSHHPTRQILLQLICLERPQTNWNVLESVVELYALVAE
jgi:hypothetical protein